MWTKDRIHHLATRSDRYTSRAHNLLPEWADEAVSDPSAVMHPVDVEQPYARICTGYSAGYGGYLTVVYLELGNGELYGVTAYPARRRA